MQTFDSLPRKKKKVLSRFICALMSTITQTQTETKNCIYDSKILSVKSCSDHPSGLLLKITEPHHRLNLRPLPWDSPCGSCTLCSGWCSCPSFHSGRTLHTLHAGLHHHHLHPRKYKKLDFQTSTQFNDEQTFKAFLGKICERKIKFLSSFGNNMVVWLVNFRNWSSKPHGMPPK